MKINKDKIIKNICYTELVYERINKKLKINYSKDQIEKLILDLLKITSLEDYSKTGKNYYVTNSDKKDPYNSQFQHLQSNNCRSN